MNDDRERRAYEMLRWVPYTLPTEFDPALAMAGYYTQLQDHRSNKALEEFERNLPDDTSPELHAYQILQAIGHLKEHDYYSPARAKRGDYTAALKRITTRNDPAVSSSADRTQGQVASNRRRRSRQRLASGYAEPCRTSRGT
jgi:hypothetical protein